MTIDRVSPPQNMLAFALTRQLQTLFGSAQTERQPLSVIVERLRDIFWPMFGCDSIGGPENVLGLAAMALFFRVDKQWEFNYCFDSRLSRGANHAPQELAAFLLESEILEKLEDSSDATISWHPFNVPFGAAEWIEESLLGIRIDLEGISWAIVLLRPERFEDLHVDALKAIAPTLAKLLDLPFAQE